tara:strand:+ start:203 stop:439 length:237 start_codon:yes stop_codon:yes gene_type:complete
MSIDNENPDLLIPIQPENQMKEWLINYVGARLQPESDEVNVEMIIKVMAEEFPEFLMPVAEENFIRGYRQAIFDMDQK